MKAIINLLYTHKIVYFTILVTITNTSLQSIIRPTPNTIHTWDQIQESLGPKKNFFFLVQAGSTILVRGNDQQKMLNLQFDAQSLTNIKGLRMTKGTYLHPRFDIEKKSYSLMSDPTHIQKLVRFGRLNSKDAPQYESIMLYLPVIYYGVTYRAYINDPWPAKIADNTNTTNLAETYLHAYGY